ncbi:hypothetical protein BDZ89DRAFT_1161426 [Hymenopellis radicata]|nr:hypothetical protein BDZ89DRAFT_1161426 [Hymenopellis radicata]
MEGKATLNYQGLLSISLNSDDVHRIKVDEHVGIVITSFREGGIAVSDLENGSLLWALSERHVPDYAHVEYEKGYLIFNMLGTRKEVWRLVEHQGDLASPTDSHPDTQQERAYGHARRTYESTYPRGHFSPWCVLHIPTITSAFRFVYPTLLTATRRMMYLYDIPSGRLEKDIRVSPEDPELNVQTLLSYVELSERYIFVCGYPSLRILSRATGRVLLDIPSDRVTYSDNVYALSRMVHTSTNSMLCVHDTYVRPPVRIPAGMQRIYEQFGAVHVSPCGRHLVLLGASSRILVFPYFERLFQGHPSSLTYEDIAIEIELGSRTRMSQYLAFDGSRVGVVTGTGVYIVHVPALVDEEGPPSACRVVALDKPQALTEVSCLQMSDTALWLTWKYPLNPEDDSERVDFNSYLEEPLEYSVFTPEHPIGAINLRPAPDHDPLVEVTLAAVCIIDFADPPPSS